MSNSGPGAAGELLVGFNRERRTARPDSPVFKESEISKFEKLKHLAHGSSAKYVEAGKKLTVQERQRYNLYLDANEISAEKYPRLPVPGQGAGVAPRARPR